jgi:hypothetical protein
MSSSLKADFSTLVMSIGSAAVMALGEAPNPQSGKIEKNMDMAKFNIDLLKVLKEKTKNNLDSEESQLIDKMISDLQLRYINK